MLSNLMMKTMVQMMSIELDGFTWIGNNRVYTIVKNSTGVAEAPDSW